VAADDGVGDEVTEFEENAFAGFDGMQSLGTPGDGIWIFFVVAGHPGVEVPAVVVELPCCDQLLDVRARFLFEEMKPGDDIGDLHAGVVDVVLHFDAVIGRAKHAYKCVAEDGVAQMADVRGFVRIDVRVFDDDLTGAGVVAADSSAVRT